MEQIALPKRPKYYTDRDVVVAAALGDRMAAELLVARKIIDWVIVNLAQIDCEAPEPRPFPEDWRDLVEGARAAEKRAGCEHCYGLELLEEYDRVTACLKEEVETGGDTNNGNETKD